MLNPAIIAIIVSSLLITGYAVYASLFAVQIVRHWDPHCGSERQIALERRTCLISTVMAYLFGLVFFSTFLFIYTGDHIHPFFVGAMCAAGTFNVNAYGYPALLLKVLNFFLCGLWLILNHADGRAEDYPLIRIKYRALIVITLLLALDTLLTLNYFGALRIDVITSCCGTLFSLETQTVGGQLAALPTRTTAVLLFLGLGLHLRSGLHLWVSGNGARFFGHWSAGLLAFGLAAVIGVISVYYYELPTHHCPFCLLQGDYHWIGYPLYATLFTGGIAGAGVAALEHYRERPSLRAIVPQLQKKLCGWSMLAYVLFAVICAFPMLFSDFKLNI